MRSPRRAPAASPRPLRRWTVLTAAGLLLAALAGLACSSKSDRYAEYVEAAREYRKDERLDAAVLELQNAIELDPRRGLAYNLIAEIALQRGRFDEAAFYYREAHRLAPNDPQAAVNLAVLLRSENPQYAEQLVERAIREHPRSPIGYVGRAEVALGRGQAQKAVKAARRAVQVAPDDPVGHWELGYVYSTLLVAGALPEKQAAAFRERAARAFERYLELGGEKRAAAHLELARIYEEWPDHQQPMFEHFVEAVRIAEETGDRATQLRAARLAERAGRRLDHRPLRIMALERLVELDPDDTEAWALLSRLKARSPMLVKKRVESGPEDPEERLTEARRILKEEGYPTAVAYLEASARAGIDPPLLYGAAINLHWATGHPQKARKTLRVLRRKFPDHPRTRLEIAQALIRSGERERGLRQLYELVEQQESLDALRLIAETELALGRLGQAAAASDRALALSEGFSVRDQRIRARILHAADAWGPAEQLLELLDRRAGLSDAERVMWLRARYYNGAEMEARRHLLKLLRSKDAPPEAAVLFAEIEWGRRSHSSQLRNVLERVHQRHPGHPKLLELLTDLDLRAGRARRAAKRLAELPKERSSPGLRMLRARTRAALGEPEAALEHAREAFAAVPHRPEALALVAGLLEDAGRRDAEIERLRAQTAPSPGERALLGRLLADRGDTAAARSVFEQAQAADAALPSLRLAWAALEHRAGDLERARRLAQEALARLGSHPLAHRELGTILLESGQHAEALAHLDVARRSARLPDAEVFYYAGLALEALGEGERATRSLQSALSIDPDFPHHDDARQQLQRLRRNGEASPS